MASTALDPLAPAGAGDQPEAGPGCRRPALCEWCGEGVAKYRCPACELRSCSAACVKAHKEERECSGKRPRTNFVAPMRAFSDQDVTRDFGLLEEADAAADRAARDLRHTQGELYQQSRQRHREALAWACAAPQRQVRLILAPAVLEVARTNTTRVQGGSGAQRGKAAWKKGRGRGFMGVKPEYIAWKVDWHFRASGQLLTDRGLPEHEVLGPALERFLQNTCPWGATRHLVLPYADAGLEALEVFLHQPRRTAAPVESFSRDTRWNDAGDKESDTDDEADADLRASRREAMTATMAALPEFLRLDKGRSLRENLVGRAIVEFPVLHVALPGEVAQYECSPMG